LFGLIYAKVKHISVSVLKKRCSYNDLEKPGWHIASRDNQLFIGTTNGDVISLGFGHCISPCPLLFGLICAKVNHISASLLKKSCPHKDLEKPG